MPEYRAVLVAPDGDWTVDFKQKSIEDVENALANMGSRWYFYPFHAVIKAKAVTTSRQRLLSVAPPFEEFKGRTIKTFSRHIANMPKHELEALLG